MIFQQCGKEHSLDEIELVNKRPDEVAVMPAEQRQRSVKEDNDLCAMDTTLEAIEHFVRA
jgi:hypothetical protein